MFTQIQTSNYKLENEHTKTNTGDTLSGCGNESDKEMATCVHTGNIELIQLIVSFHLNKLFLRQFQYTV